MNRGDTDLYDALQKIEQVEQDLSKTVRESEREAEIEARETPVIPAEVVDDLRDDLTRARAALVDALLARELDTSTPTRERSNTAPGTDVPHFRQVHQRPLFDGEGDE